MDFLFLLTRGVCFDTVAPATNRTVLARFLNASIPLSRYMVFDHIDVPSWEYQKTLSPLDFLFFYSQGTCALHTIAFAINRTVLARFLNASIPLPRYMVFDHIDVPLGSTKKSQSALFFLLQGEKLYTTCNFVVDPLNSGKVVKTSLTIDAPLNAFLYVEYKKVSKLLTFLFYLNRAINLPQVALIFSLIFLFCISLIVINCDAPIISRISLYIRITPSPYTYIPALKCL